MNPIFEEDGMHWVRIPGVRVFGKHGCFTRPEFRSERVSYEVMTPPAAQGVMDNTLWREGAKWKLERLELLSRIQTYQMTRHEASSVYTNATNLIKGGGVDMDSNFTLRRTVLLHEPDYLLHFRLGHEDYDTVRKLEAMALRYLAQGRTFYSRYLGMREMEARVKLVTKREEAPPVVDDTRELGFMVHSYTWEDGKRVKTGFFNARLDHGIMEVPMKPMMEAS